MLRLGLLVAAVLAVLGLPGVPRADSLDDSAMVPVPVDQVVDVAVVDGLTPGAPPPDVDPGDVEEPDAPPLGAVEPKHQVVELPRVHVPRGFDAATSRRVDARTTGNQVVYANADGSFTTFTNAQDVRFEDGGEWVDIDRSLVTDESGVLRAKASPEGIALSLDDAGKAPVVRLPTAAGDLVLRYSGVVVEVDRAASKPVPGADDAPAGSAGKVAEIDQSGRSALLRGRDGIGLRARVLTDGVKVDVVLSQRPASNEFTVDVVMPAKVSARESDGGVEFVDGAGGVISSVVDGIAVDQVALASATDVAPEGTVTGVKVRLGRVVGRAVELVLSVDGAWLGDAARVYPVVVDPVVALGTSSGYADVYFSSDCPGCTAPTGGPDAGIPYRDLPYLRVGKRCSGCGETEMFLPFAGAMSIPGAGYTLAAGNSMSFTTTGVGDSGFCSASADVSVQALATALSSGATWNTRPGGTGATVNHTWALTYASESFPIDTVIGPYSPHLPSPPVWQGVKITANVASSLCAYRLTSSENGGGGPVLVLNWNLPGSGGGGGGTTGGDPITGCAFNPCGDTPTGDTVGDPVNVVIGNLVDRYSDMGSPAGVFGLEWGRTYNSYELDAPGQMGRGWATTLGITLVQEGDGKVRMIAPDGRRVRWTPNGSAWSRPVNFPADLTQVAGLWKVTFNDGTVWDFDSSNRLVKMTSWTGENVTITYNGSGQLVSASSSKGVSDGLCRSSSCSEVVT